MFKIIRILGILFILYFVFNSFGDKIINFGTNIKKISDIEPAPAPNKISKESVSNDCGGANYNQIESSYMERKIAGILASFAETPQGQDVFKQIIKPISSTKGPYENTNKVSAISNIKTLKSASNGKSAFCSAIVSVSNNTDNKIEHIILGEEQFEPGFDSIIANMKVGEQKLITTNTGKEIDITLLNVANDYEKPANMFYFFGGYDFIPGCGKEVTLDFKIHSHDFSYNYHLFGKTKKSVTLKLSKQNLPTSLLNILSSLNLGGNVSIIYTREELMKIITKYNKIFGNIELPNKPVFVLDILMIDAKPSISKENKINVQIN